MDYIIVNGELYHHGVKGMRWGVRRYQNKDGSLTPAGKKRYSGDATSGPDVQTTKTDYGSIRKIAYQNKSNTAGKNNLDKMAELEDYDSAISKFDNEVVNYAYNLQKGRDYADKILHERLKDYSYTLMESREHYAGEEYISYYLKVNGNNRSYITNGDGDYFDEQYFM